MVVGRAIVERLLRVETNDGEEDRGEHLGKGGAQEIHATRRWAYSRVSHALAVRTIDHAFSTGRSRRGGLDCIEGFFLQVFMVASLLTSGNPSRR